MKVTRIKNSLAADLAHEIILGCDVFDADDIWGIIGKCSVEELHKLERDVRQYIYEIWPPESGAWSEDFLKKQIDYWIYQFTWRKPKKKELPNWVFTVVVVIAVLVLAVLLNSK